MNKTYHARNRQDLIDIFTKRGRPLEVISDIGSYTPYDTDSENHIFDEAMFMFTFGADIVTLIY